MLDIKFIRDNKDLVIAGAKKKHIHFDVLKLLAIDDKRLTLLQSIEKKKAEQNQWNDTIAAASADERARMIDEMRVIKESFQKEEEEQKGVMKEWQGLMLSVPNIPDISVPDGESDAHNQEIRTWGEKTNFSFKPKSHIELMESLDMVDFERGADVSGFRGYFLKNDAVRLNFALWQFVFNFFSTKPDWTPMIVPSLVRKESLFGTGYLPQGDEDLYHTQDGEYLAGTGEVAAMGYFMGQIIPKVKLPLKIFAFSPCFRREAGSHGKDTKGLMRVHEFFKFEQVVLCEANHATSVTHHEEITANAEALMQALKIPYRVVLNCGGDLGLGQVKKYDIEAWVPSENTYRETHSASYFHDFQSRRSSIRYKDTDGKLRFAHSLNSTALPTPRPLIPLIENYQQADGTIVVPDCLQPYMGKKVIGSSK